MLDQAKFKRETNKFFNESELKSIQEYIFALQPTVVTIEGKSMLKTCDISIEKFLGKELSDKVYRFCDKWTPAAKEEKTVDMGFWDISGNYIEDIQQINERDI